GPAYFSCFAEALSAAGEQMGLSRQYASIMAMHACHGAARMMLESGEPPADLRAKVTSPGGTTQAAIENMQESEVFERIIRGVHAARDRSERLGQ
ncbi:MAG: pyrroline-5-carboxylate reductase, partial [bacterium]|nr:pyrroline-5-carboxylate reductase [bacterium]